MTLRIHDTYQRTKVDFVPHDATHATTTKNFTMLPAGTLSPQKARVLLLLALMAGYIRADLEAELQSLGLMAV